MTNQYGPRVSYDQMNVGVRVYYTGDMANIEGTGTITRKHVSDRFGYRMVDIEMDDGRTMRGIHDLNFQPAPGRRFWLLADWQAKREADIAAFKERYAHLA